ncbi:MAG TPA: ubiquinone biosynthesis hydroxylase [Bauldia sp.]|nr:ubiquinone biosynthesis hydroxylase [Bauldia sp.]
MDMDVLIAGGGQVGLTLALALRRFAPTLAVTLVDAAPPDAASREGRASTIVAGGRNMLVELGVWDAIVPQAQPVTEMVVTDSRAHDLVRPVFLTFATAAQADGASAHVVADGVVVAALRHAATAAGVTTIAPAAVSDFEVKPSAIEAMLADGRRVDSRLLIAADGVRSRLRGLAGVATIGRRYGQTGIVATVEHERPHGGRAEEHFLPSGPFAMLPMVDDAEGRHRSSLVWTEPDDVAARLVAGDPLVFAVELERRFGRRLGTIKVAGKPLAFPLAVSLAREFVRPRFALAGDAAHTIHPIAGQGLNLGYRDVAALAETIVEAHRLGLDIGSIGVLERYQRWRRYDTAEMAMITDVLNRLFANDNSAARLVRDIGLGLVDRLPGLKTLFMGEASGDRGDAPRLLRGEAI